MKDTTVHHMIQVAGANVTAWGIALADINTVLTTVSVILAISYTLYKFWKDTRKD